MSASSSSSSTTITNTLEASRLKYPRDSKYRFKRNAAPTDQDTCDGTAAGLTKYQIKRARGADAPGPSADMYDVFLAASAALHKQREREVADLKQAAAQKEVDNGNLKSEYQRRLSELEARDQAKQQEVEQLQKQCVVGIAAAKSECEQLVDQVKQAAQREIDELREGKARVEQELAEQQSSFKAKCEKAEKIHLKLMAEKEQEVMRRAEQRHKELLAKHEEEEEKRFGEEMDLVIEDVSKKDEEIKAQKKQIEYLIAKVRMEKKENKRLVKENKKLDKALEKSDDMTLKYMRLVYVETGKSEEVLKEALEKEEENERLLQHVDMLKADIKSGVGAAGELLEKTTLKGNENRKKMPSEKRNSAKMGAARTRAGTAPKGVQKAKYTNKDALKKALDLLDNGDDECFDDDLDAMPTDDESESEQATPKCAHLKDRGLNATFGLISPPDSERDLSMVQ
ncbi:hypothetical protein M409DRAFT_28036 [Zasmidium cellare ATCC 36951]|uniref:Uncharacterized protein n=1 Tax=Zasmidium cellare ATCC 36951 TaxID=1080233 RepID=A0A6A6C3P8_ZASCE|nr:uncharacterized protein M409DRAFT_28036 [Zasmidium cellare ATCC 36951]KAF2161641.1 hypothetical protein M409DRAFT_28036 [Zasmidium cellare ATCC 36951]